MSTSNAYRNGVKAFKKGKTLEDNPYPRWSAGYHDFRRGFIRCEEGIEWLAK